MNHKQAYEALVKQVMNDDKVSFETVEKAKEINDQISKEPAENKQSDAERKKEILSIKDRRERQQAIREKMELFQ